jgi:hypothetical protein
MDHKLRRNHIQDQEKMPSDEFLESHFKLCLLRYFAGWANLVIADTNRHMNALLERHKYSIDLSEECWVIGTGKQALELFFAQRLFGAIISSIDADDQGRNHWSYPRFAKLVEIHTPAEGPDWPESFDEFQFLGTLYGQYGRFIPGRHVVLEPNADYVKNSNA